jgi:hypothetical protein
MGDLSAIADELSAERNIPTSCRDKLLAALDLAKKDYVAGMNQDKRDAQLRSSDTGKRIKKFVQSSYAAHDAYNKLDEHTKAVLHCEGMLDENAMVQLSRAGYYCETMITKRRHRPINTGLYLLVYNLLNFWGTHVSAESVYARFQDAEDPASDAPEMCREPTNDVSKFVVKAAEALIDEPLSSATLEAMIKRVLAGPPSRRVLPDPPRL